jgi:hypothetical protein
MESSTRLGLPDEVQYTFVFTNGDSEREIKIWINDAVENVNLMAIVEALGEVIQAYTRQEPILK